MTSVHGWLPEFDVALLSVGEESGRLDTTFKLLARYYASRAKIIRDTISGLIVTVDDAACFSARFSARLSHRASRKASSTIILRNAFRSLFEKIVVFGALYGVAFLLYFCLPGKSRRKLARIGRIHFSMSFRCCARP